MKKITIIALFAALGMVSCNDKKAEATTTETSTTTTTDTAPVDPHAGHNHAPGEGHDHDHGAQTEVAEGMNPPHGQPNHRCDIAVGAPLNSPPGQAAGQTSAPVATQSGQSGFLGGNAQTQAPAQQQATPQMPAQETAPGMKGKPNPAHGQPGHRCDVSVGQPLP